MKTPDAVKKQSEKTSTRHGAYLWSFEVRLLELEIWTFPSVCAEQRSKTGISETRV
jgi:hypothetical protein